MLHFRTEVRNKDGKIFRDEKGCPQPGLNTTLDVGVKAQSSIYAHCMDIYRFMNAVSDSNDITISVMVKSNISDTYMTVYSFYGSEKRFVEHK
jgi:predicted metal-dependent enzyme (double-stranded beta helix superfamily)